MSSNVLMISLGCGCFVGVADAPSAGNAAVGEAQPQPPPLPPAQSSPADKETIAPPKLPQQAAKGVKVSKQKAVPKQWTMNDEDKDTYEYVLAAIKRRSKYGGAVVGIGVGSTEFDESTERALLARTSSASTEPADEAKAVGVAPVVSAVSALARDELLRQRMGLDKPGLINSDTSASERLEAELLGSSGETVTAAAAMASMMRKKDATAKATSTSKSASSDAAATAKPAPAMSLHREWSKLGVAGLGKFASKVRSVAPDALSKSIGESVSKCDKHLSLCERGECGVSMWCLGSLQLDEGLFVGIVRALIHLAPTDADFAKQVRNPFQQ